MKHFFRLYKSRFAGNPSMSIGVCSIDGLLNYNVGTISESATFDNFFIFTQTQGLVEICSFIYTPSARRLADELFTDIIWGE